ERIAEFMVHLDGDRVELLRAVQCDAGLAGARFVKDGLVCHAYSDAADRPPLRRQAARQPLRDWREELTRYPPASQQSLPARLAQGLRLRSGRKAEQRRRGDAP